MIWCVTIYFVTTSNALKFYFNVVFLFYSFLVLSVLYLYHWICKPNVISLKVDASSPSLPPSFFQIYNVHPEFAQRISAANNAFQTCRIQWKLTSCLFQYFNGKKIQNWQFLIDWTPGTKKLKISEAARLSECMYQALISFIKI